MPQDCGRKGDGFFCSRGCVCHDKCNSSDTLCGNKSNKASKHATQMQLMARRCKHPEGVGHRRKLPVFIFMQANVVDDAFHSWLPPLPLPALATGLDLQLQQQQRRSKLRGLCAHRWMPPGTGYYARPDCKGQRHLAAVAHTNKTNYSQRGGRGERGRTGMQRRIRKICAATNQNCVIKTQIQFEQVKSMCCTLHVAHCTLHIVAQLEAPQWIHFWHVTPERCKAVDTTTNTFQT